MNYLLSAGTQNEDILTIAIVLFVFGVAIFLSSFLKKKLGQSENGIDFSRNGGKIRVTIKQPYMPAKAFMFYNALQRALPLEFIAFPNVGVDNIVAPAGDLVAFKSIQSKYVDYAIFDKRTMKPVAVVDLIDPALAAGGIIEQDIAITKTLQTVNMPVLEFRVMKQYDEKAILAKFLDSQDAYTIAELKKAKEERGIH